MVKQIIASPETLNLVLESWFVQNVWFDGAPYSLTHGSKPAGSPLVYLEFKDINRDFVRHLKSTGNAVVLYHMADELGDADIAAYDDCDLVVRNYFFPHIIDRPGYAGKVIWAPNGFRTGVGPRNHDRIKKAGERQCLAAFLGWLDNAASHGNERALFAGMAPGCGEHLYCHPTVGFGAGYSLGLYSAIMEDSVFAPCPAGNSPETIRIYDALELGCIPISLPHRFLTSEQALAAIGPVPFPLIESWNLLPDYLASMKSAMAGDPAKIAAMQGKCIEWWKNYKAFMCKTIASRCRGLDATRRYGPLRTLARRLASR